MRVILKTFVGKKKKVISKASLNILEVNNIHV